MQRDTVLFRDDDSQAHFSVAPTPSGNSLVKNLQGNWGHHIPKVGSKARHRKPMLKKCPHLGSSPTRLLLPLAHVLSAEHTHSECLKVHGDDGVSQRLYQLYYREK